MGWGSEFAGHEGYVRGLVPILDDHDHETGRFVELGYPNGSDVKNVRYVQVACECGWRSQRMTAPIGTNYSPYTIWIPSDRYEDRARAIWQRHIEDVRAHGDATLFEDR